MARNPKGHPKTAKGKRWLALVKQYGVIGASQRRHNPGNPVNPWVHSYDSVHRKMVHTGKYFRGGKSRRNPKAISLFRNPVAAISHNLVHPFTMDNLWNGLGLTGGAVGTVVLPNLLLGKMAMYQNWYFRIPAKLLTATILATGTNIFTKKHDVAKNVMLGGLFMTVLSETIGILNASSNLFSQKVAANLTKPTGMGATDAEVKRRIEAQVRKQLGIGNPGVQVPYETVGSTGVQVPYETIGERLDRVDEDEND